MPGSSARATPGSGAGICLATTAATTGGVWRHLCDVATALRERDIPVRITIPADATRLHDEAHQRGFRVGPREHEREVFHAHLGNTYDRTMTADLVRARLAGARVVVTEHLPRSDASDARLAERPGRPGARIAKTALKRVHFGVADRVIAVSAGSAEFLAERYGLTAPKLTVIRNGVSIEDEPTSPMRRLDVTRPDVLRLVATGSVIAQKGFDLLIAAGDRAQQPWRVDVYGTGPHLEHVRRSAAHLRLADGTPRIVFHGWTDDVKARVTEADALVMPSRWEAMPYSALEAMSWARPVIATRVDGLSEAVLPGITGVLVPVDPAALAAALDDFSRNRSAAEALGRAGRGRVGSDFTLDTMVDRTVAVYAQCLGVPLERAIVQASR